MKARILFFLLLLFCNYSHAQLFAFDNFSHREGLNIGAINCINQSDNGYIWLGTDGAGLVRFDGKKFEEIEFKGQDNNHHVRNIYFDGEDILFSSQYNGFYRYSKHSGEISSMISESHSIGDRLNVLKHNGTYYFIGAKGVVSKKNDVEKFIKTFSVEEPLVIYQTINAKHRVIITTNKGNFCIDNQKVTPLNEWLDIPKEVADKYRFGYMFQDKLTLFNPTCEDWIEVVFNDHGKLYSLKEFQQPTRLDAGDPVVSFSFNKTSKAAILLTEKGQLFDLIDLKRELGLIVHNSLDPFSGPLGVYADLNGIYWVNSSLRGIYKVAEKTFTDVQAYSVLTLENIAFPYQTTDKRILISTFDGVTFALENNLAKEHSTFNFQLYGATEMDNGDCYFATNKGIKRYTPNKPIKFESVIDPGNSISFIFADGQDLWYGVRSKGLYRYNLKTKEKTIFNNFHDLPSYIYTAQLSAKEDVLYIGTNDGIIQYNKSTNKFSPLAYESKYGSYSGISAKDSYGNIWFTLDKGLLVITPKAVKVHDSKDYMPSNLLFTLNGDLYSNIIVGTNKGITILKTNAEGNITRSTTYNSESGFMGYETHMRSQFQFENQIYLGTVEGLFAIDTKILENLDKPLRPLIFDISNDGLEAGMTQSPDAFRFRFQVNNPKNENLIYRYRIRERNLEWQYLTEVDIVQIMELSNGTYTLEVGSSYDGELFSSSSYHHFRISLPFWKTTWFFISLIALVVLINIFLLTYGKKYDSSKFLSTKDTDVALRMTPATLMFSTIIVPGAQLLTKAINPSFPLNFGGTLITGFLLLALYLISLNAKKTGQINQYKYLLSSALYISTIFFIWEVHRTNIHPFHLIAVILITTISPYVLNKVRSTIIYALIIFLAMTAVILLTDEAVYPKTYVIIAILSALSVMIFNSYLRYNSLEKLLFVSGIINHGNFPVIAYRKDGTVIYVSENINKFIDINHEELINSNISLLNKFSLFDENYKNVDVTKGLKEDDKYLTPMTDSQQGVSWMEWSYKRFSENNQVIIGQDVSERIEFQNTYELLVQNVEDLIFNLDAHGNFVFVNKAFIEKLGYSKDEIIGEQSLNLVSEKHQDQIQKFYGEHFNEKRETSYMELPIQTKSGKVIWIGQHVNTIYAPGTKSYIMGFIALARDITDLREQQQVIKTQRDDITSSINYARKIQVNLLPHEHRFIENFECHFILYRPKDIVSGDFYWVQRIDDKLVIVLADCTGHGVPGAFMTLLGLNMLNSIVLDARLTEPGMILNELDKRLEDYFQKQVATEKMNDGMELTVCVIDDNSQDIAYACAGARFLIHSDNGFTMFKGNNEHIGDSKSEGFPGYLTHYTAFNNSDSLYLFTDGFQDQFGGINNKKFSFRRLLELLESNVKMPLPEQHKMIEEEFDSWKGSESQTDDVAILGLRRKDI